MLLAALETAILVVFLGAALFLSAGRVDWPMAWAFMGVWLAFSALGFLVLSRALIVERGRLVAGGERSDLLLASSFAVLLYPGTLITCGLDTRFAWSPPLPEIAQLLALGLFAVGYAFAFWAMYVNPFFSTVVRIQAERGHRLVDQGPYRFVRHPGYAGAMAAHLVLPIALDSLWGLVPAVLGSVLLAARSVREERTLERELAGYSAYILRVRWRLLPGIW